MAFQRNLNQQEKALLEIASQYSSPTEFRKHNLPKYLLTQRKNLIRTAFPNQPKAVIEHSTKTEVIKGVYILYRDEEIIYVGKSTSNIHARIRNHHKNGMEYTSYRIHLLDNEALIHLLEVYLIVKHTPTLNSDCITQDSLPTQIPLLEELLLSPIEGKGKPIVKRVPNTSKYVAPPKKSASEKIKEYFDKTIL